MHSSNLKGILFKAFKHMHTDPGVSLYKLNSFCQTIDKFKTKTMSSLLNNTIKYEYFTR